MCSRRLPGVGSSTRPKTRVGAGPPKPAAGPISTDPSSSRPRTRESRTAAQKAASASGSRLSTTSSEKRQAMPPRLDPARETEILTTNLGFVRIVRFASPQGMSFGVLDGDGQVAQIEGHPFGRISFTGARYAQADVRLLSPILPSKVVCVGKNYAEHIEEMRGLTGDAPKEPLLFLNPPPSVIGPGAAIRIPPGSTNVHHEAELAVVIGPRGARHVTPDQAAASIFGYTIGNDVTERDMQKSDGQWTR